MQTNDKLYEGVELPTKTLDLPLNTEIIRQAHGLMMEEEKDVLAGEYRKSPGFAGYHIFASAGYIERYMEDAVFRFHETKKDDLIMAATYFFGNIISIHPFEDGNGKICRLILAHVLIQIKCCLFPVILSSFHGHGSRHYIRAVKMFDRKLSMLYTMIVKSLIHYWYSVCKNDLTGAQNLIKMTSVMPFVFNVVTLYVVTINEKLWTRAREVHRALEYGKTTKAADIVKHLHSRENYAHKYQLNDFVSETNLD